MNHRPTFMWEYPNFNSQDLILKKERILRLQSASRPAVTIRRSYLSLYYFVLWPVMPTTANRQPQNHLAVLSAEVVLWQLVAVEILCRAAPFFANIAGTSMEGVPWEHSTDIT